MPCAISGGRSDMMRRLPPPPSHGPPGELRPGQLIAGRFVVDRILGRGRGTLARAQHAGFDLHVAVRVVPPALVDPRAFDRFHREARILAQLESEHVARIHDFGTLEDGSLYFVREYVGGETLASYARRRRGLPLDEAVLLLLQVGEAVAEAHARGVVLRDLSSSQVMITVKRSGAVMAKVVDMGTCKLLRVPPDLTATRLHGISACASPELVRQSSELDERADVWSLGCLFYELITGRPAFEGEGAALMLRIAHDEPVPASQLRPELPQRLDAIVRWTLSKDPDGRFRSVHAMARELRAFACQRGHLLADQIAEIAAPRALARRPAPPARPLPWSAPHAVCDDRSLPAAVVSVPRAPEPTRSSQPSSHALPTLRSPPRPMLSTPAGEARRLRLRPQRTRLAAAVWGTVLLVPIATILLAVSIGSVPPLRAREGLATAAYLAAPLDLEDERRR